MKNAAEQKYEKPKLIWAIDPTQRETRPSLVHFHAIQQLVESMGWEIRPVTVLSPSGRNVERGIFGSVSRMQLQLDKYLKPFGLPESSRARVLVQKEAGQAAAVETLIDYATRSQAVGIAVSSHGREGLDRLVLGSFAEKTLENSPFPVFFLGHQGVPSPGNSILFLTDFSKNSWLAYCQFLSTFSGSATPVILYHAVTYPMAPDMGMGIYLPDNFMKEQKEWAEAEGARWVSEARARNVQVKLVLYMGGIGTLGSDAILSAATEHNVCAIVMTTKSNAFGRAILGSVAFPVFRSNRYLTMMYGPQSLASAGKERSEGPIAEAVMG